MKSFRDFADDLVLNEAFLHFKHLVCFLQQLELLYKADISKRDESAALLVEVDPSSVDDELAISVLVFI